MKTYRKIYININSKCNCKCINCILKEEIREDINILHLDDITNLIGEIRDNYFDEHLNIVEISGGEPTLHPNFLEIIKSLHQAKEEGLVYKVTLLTNALTSSDMTFCSSLSRYLDDIVVTLYDTNPEVHDSFTQIPGSFQKKCQAIDNFISLGVKVHLKLLVIKPSYQHLPQMASFIVEKWGKQVHVAINGTHYTGDAYKNQDLLSFNYVNAVKYIEKALDIFDSAKITSSIFFPLCLLDPIYWKHSPLGFKDLIDNSISVSPTYELGKANRLLDEFVNRSEICQDCILLSRCNWPWKKYCEIHGETDIAIAKTNMYKNIIV